MNASTQVLAFAPISAVAEFVRKKELSPVELVRASLARIEALDSKLKFSLASEARLTESTLICKNP